MNSGSVELEPPSFSTLYYIPDWLEKAQESLGTQETKQNTDVSVDCVRNSNSAKRNTTSLAPKQSKPGRIPTARPYNSRRGTPRNPYSSHKINRRTVNAKPVEDDEVLTFVAMVYVLPIPPYVMEGLYKYNEREYGAFTTDISKSVEEYKAYFRHQGIQDVQFLYRWFGQIKDFGDWRRRCHQLGFGGLPDDDIRGLYSQIKHVKILARDPADRPSLGNYHFLIQMILFFLWRYNSGNGYLSEDTSTPESRRRAEFFVTALSRLIRFVTELKVKQLVKVYDPPTRKWRDGRVDAVDDRQKMLKVQLAGNNGSDYQWIHALSSKLAPNELKYSFVPTPSAQPIPSICSVLDDQLKAVAPRGFSINAAIQNAQSVQDNSKFQFGSPSKNVSVVPPKQLQNQSANDNPNDEDLWFWPNRSLQRSGKCNSGTLGDLFMACMRGDIGPDDHVHCDRYGSIPKPLQEFPVIVRVFRKHVAEHHHRLQGGSVQNSVQNSVQSPQQSMSPSGSNRPRLSLSRVSSGTSGSGSIPHPKQGLSPRMNEMTF